jgi:hypothetical protein
MRRSSLAFVVLGLLLGLLIAVTSAAGSGQKAAPFNQVEGHGKGHGKGHAKADSNTRMRWDIIRLSTLPPPATTLPGGRASACAASSCANMITLTGSGTFRSNPGRPQDVTGGGTWTAVGFGAGSGTYTVTGFVSFVLAPGTLPSPPFTDGVTGVAADARAGLLVLRIAYSDGDEGVLVLSCDLPGTPSNLPIFEGITVSKGFVDYWNRVAPESVAPFGNRTAFHALG